MYKVIRKNNKGFSILEVVVALYIITMGLIGVLALVVQNIQAEYINTKTLVASQLAQEGLELVRNIRDTNWLINANWKDCDSAGSNCDIVQSAGGNTTYGIYLDYSTNNIIIDATINSIDNAPLYINGNGFYTHVVFAETTAFYRLITVTDGGDYLVVECQVRWQTGKGSHDYKAETYLYDWR